MSKVKTTLRKLYDGRASLQVISDLELDLSPSFNIGKNIATFNDLMEVFETARKKLWRRAYEVLPEEGKPGVPKEGFTEASIRDEIDSLLAEEIEIDVRMIKMERLTRNGEPITVKPAVLAGITWMIVDEGEEVT